MDGKRDKFVFLYYFITNKTSQQMQKNKNT